MTIEDLVAFLRARLDEDEQVARRVEPNQAPVDLRAMVTRDGSAPFLVIDSARVLAEVDAKQRIINELVDSYAAPRDEGEYALWHKIGHDYARFKVLRLLALPYANHPDYRDEWRPDLS